MKKNILIRLENISKRFDDNLVLDGISLNIRKNEFLTLLGPSGCGKTTTLRILGGFEKSDTGQVLHHEKDIKDVPPYKRNINTVFQRYALFPHMNVYHNVAFGLTVKKESKEIIKDKVTKALERVNLTGYEKRSVNQLSGGQQQRVAIARAIINEPEVLLLDEPLGALDLKLRQEMQYELKSLQQDLGITFVYVTHDQEEALTMSDTVVVMNNGIIQQLGTPEDIYNEPVNAFVADFIGESNIFEGVMKEDRSLELFGHRLECVDTGFERDELIDVVIRPEDLIVEQTASEKGIDQSSEKDGSGDLSTGKLVGTVTDCIFKGVHYETCIDTYGHEWVIHNTKSFTPGEQVTISVDPFDIHIMKKPTETSGMVAEAEETMERSDNTEEAHNTTED